MNETILLEVKTYTLQQYADNIAKCCSKTVIRRIKLGLLPTNHHVILGKQYIITVHPPTNKELANNTELACIEFHKLCKGVVRGNIEQLEFKRELAAEICIKHNVNTSKFFAMQGLK